MGLILQANGIKKQYGTRTILDFEGLQVYEGDKIGIVGLNGTGKTTLLSILCGEVEPDEGKVVRSCGVAFIRQFDENESSLSGGENVKRRIQRETSAEDTIVFADEPTANLDRDGVKWVQSKLESARTVLLISHDRELLDNICTRIIEVKDGALNFYTGNYSDYVLESRKARARQESEYAEYNRKKEQLASAVQSYEQKLGAANRRTKREYQKNPSEARLAIGARAARQKKIERVEKVLVTRLERLEKVERPREPPRLRMDFSLTNPPKNKNVITCEDLCFSYCDKVIFSGAEFVIPANKKIAVTGKNGAGKTTLLKLIYDGHPNITKAPKLKIGYLYQGLENLVPERTALENVLLNSVQDKASVYSILAGLLFGGDGFYKKAAVLSGGEKIRLSLAMLIASGCNALMLDEPTNYLDVHSIEAVESTIKEYPGTVLIVSHDDRFLGAVAEMELKIGGGKAVIGEYAAESPEAQGAKPQDKLLLELRRTRLVGEISSAPPEKKNTLELEYAEVLRQLSELG